MVTRATCGCSIAIVLLVASCASPPTQPDSEGAATATLIPKSGGGPTKIGGGSGGVGQPGTTNPNLPTAADFITSTGVPVSISMEAVSPDSPIGPPLSLQSAGAIQLVGTFPVRYRVDFAAPAGHEAECPSPITAVANGPLAPFIATLRAKPSVAERYVIDVVVTVVEGKNAGTRLRCVQGLVVHPELPDTGKRGMVASP